MPLPVLHFASLAEIEAHRFGGNYAVDAPAIRGITAFTQEGARPIAERAAAARIMADRAMGVPFADSDTDEEIVATFVEG